VNPIFAALPNREIDEFKGSSRFPSPILYPQMNLLSFSSKVVYGHVGHSAGKLLLEQLGHTVWAIDTVVFSNHPGYGRYKGRVVPPDEIRALAYGLEALGLYAKCGAVFSGYLGSVANAGVMVEVLHRVKEINPEALFICDPIIGDREPGLYVAADLPAFFSEAVLPLADIALPNAFELEHLTGIAIHDIPSAMAAVDALRSRGPKIVVATGVQSTDAMATLAVTPEGAWAVETPRLFCRASGTGDVFGALFLGHIFGGMALEDALTQAVGGVYAVIEATRDAEELALIAAQDQAARPSRSWKARRIR
jgi:pyridoxine kinase